MKNIKIKKLIKFILLIGILLIAFFYASNYIVKALTACGELTTVIHGGTIATIDGVSGIRLYCVDPGEPLRRTSIARIGDEHPITIYQGQSEPVDIGFGFHLDANDQKRLYNLYQAQETGDQKKMQHQITLRENCSNSGCRGEYATIFNDLVPDGHPYTYFATIERFVAINSSGVPQFDLQELIDIRVYKVPHIEVKLFKYQWTPDGKVPLSGARFVIFPDAETRERFITPFNDVVYTTGADGFVHIATIAPRGLGETYTFNIVEFKTPDGYVVPEQIRSTQSLQESKILTVTMTVGPYGLIYPEMAINEDEGGGTAYPAASVEKIFDIANSEWPQENLIIETDKALINWTNSPHNPEIELVKVWNTPEGTFATDRYLPGAKFYIEPISPLAIALEQANRTLRAKQDFTGCIITDDPDGKIKIAELINAADGIYEYKVIEVEAPRGYTIPEEILENIGDSRSIEFTMQFEVRNGKIISGTQNPPGGLNVSTGAVEEGRLGRIYWKDLQTDRFQFNIRKISWPANTPIANVPFTVTVYRENGTIVGQPNNWSTNSSGNLEIANIALSEGRYRFNIRENQRPEDHRLPDGTTNSSFAFNVYFQVDASGKVVAGSLTTDLSGVAATNIIPRLDASGNIEVVVRNVKSPQIELYKHDRTNQNRAVNAEFSVAARTVPIGYTFIPINNVQLGANGRLGIIDNLIPGRYVFRITEVRPLDENYIDLGPIQVDFEFTVNANNAIINHNIAAVRKCASCSCTYI